MWLLRIISGSVAIVDTGSYVSTHIIQYVELNTRMVGIGMISNGLTKFRTLYNNYTITFTYKIKKLVADFSYV